MTPSRIDRRALVASVAALACDGHHNEGDSYPGHTVHLQESLVSRCGTLVVLHGRCPSLQSATSVAQGIEIISAYRLMRSKTDCRCK
jgi:hypothetical protein